MEEEQLQELIETLNELIASNGNLTQKETATFILEYIAVLGANNKKPDLDTHVYCTDCRNFRLDDEEIPYCARPNNKKCNGYDMEDSMPFSERPQYEKR